MKEKEELEKLRSQLEYIKQFIEEKCVYDKHLQGYCFDLKKGDVRRLMYELNKKEE